MNKEINNSKVFYPLASDNWGEEEFKSIQDVIESSQFTMGYNVKKFEIEIASKFNSSFAVMVNSGSSANFLMLATLKILLSKKLQKLKEPNIIVPAVSWSTTFTPTYYLGFKLKFCDVDAGHFGLNSESVKNAIDENTVAILTVNLLGSPSDLIALKQLAQDNGIVLLEDNCEALGASIGNSFTGTFGLMATHSSFFSHHINSMEGGWITTDSLEIAEILISLRAHGWTRQLAIDSKLREKNQEAEWFDAQFEFVLPGLNFRPIEIEAAIARTQLSKVDSMLKIRRENAKILQDLLLNFDNVSMQIANGNSSWFAFALIFKSNEFRNKISNVFRENGIECRPIVTGNFTRQPVMRYLQFEIVEELKNSELIHNNGLYIGNHPHDLNYELKTTVDLIKSLK